MLEAIIKTGSFKSAAKMLHKTQPSLSIGIKKIENEFNLTLFSRETYRPTLTAAGELFYEQSKNTLNSFRNLEKIAKEMKEGYEAKITILLDPLIRIPKIQAGLSELSKHAHPVKLQIISKMIDDTIEEKLKTKVDFAIGHLPSPIVTIESKKLSSIKMIPVISKNISKQKPLSEIPQIILKMKRNIPALAPRPGGLHWRVNDHSLKEELITEGFGWGRLPESVVKKHNNLQSLSSRGLDSYDVPLFAMKSRYRPLGPLGKIVWREICGC